MMRPRGTVVTGQDPRAAYRSRAGNRKERARETAPWAREVGHTD
jgi:hypothetical protein